jgi:nicotinate phosphoribosyltransferase
MDTGSRTESPEPLEVVQRRAAEQLMHLPEGSLRLLNPHVYRVSVSQGLFDVRAALIEKLEREM